MAEGYSHTNRKGQVFYLRKVKTRKGKDRYVFGKGEVGEPVEEIPEGFEVVEGIQGTVSLRRKRGISPISEGELEVVVAEISRHHHLRHCQARIEKKAVVVYEPRQDLAGLETLLGPRAVSVIEKNLQFSPVMRFVLVDAETRQFRVDRWCDRSWCDDWLELTLGGLHKLAVTYVPHIGRDSFFELGPGGI